MRRLLPGPILFVAAIFLFAAFPGFAQLPCGVGEDNLVVNCGLPADDSGWSANLGSITWTGSDGSANPGALLAASVPGKGSFEFAVVSDCFDASSLAGMTVGFGGDFKAFVSPVADELPLGKPPICTAQLRTYSSADCSGSPSFFFGEQVFPDSQSFSQSNGTDVAPNDTMSAQLALTCFEFGQIDNLGVDSTASRGDGAGFQMLLDDGFVGVGLVPVELQGFSIE